MPRCPNCKQSPRGGSVYCPRCGTILDDGLDHRGRWLRVGVALLVGVGILVWFLLFFGVRRIG